MYYTYYQGILYHWIHFMAAIACWLNVVENVALIGLTFISSADNHGKFVLDTVSIIKNLFVIKRKCRLMLKTVLNIFVNRYVYQEILYCYELKHNNYGLT
jgi:hypothetical protein